ncbi:FAD binding domain-containing protein [Alkalilacustris brevis]|uniref:FAD binding domain-containing protein n=1 Tax=Alkalilacustris brevis TaxID=2026338 RepID=UPI000E0D3ACA|nr:FAD binding domain-containing protein [Alkalilacustris brevis]
MKSSSFAYRRAATAEEAVALAREAGEDARFLAGGQSLLAALNFRLDEPCMLIDIGRIGALRGIRRVEGALKIGALTRHAEIAASVEIAKHLPLVAQAIHEVAHPAIRNRGTFGGSIALADAAAEMPACALALGARMHLLGPDGPRRVAADEFFLGLYETALEPGELLTHVEIPIPPAGACHGFAELARRRGDYAMAGLAMMLGPRTGAGRDWARIVFFGIADRAVRSPSAEAAIVAGAAPEECAACATDGLDVFGDMNAAESTKRHYAAVLLRRELDRISDEENRV